MKKFALAGALALVLATVAYAANAPTYKDPAGQDRDAQGIVIVNPDGSFPSITSATSATFGPSATITRTNDTNVYAANDVIGAATGSTAAQTFAVAAGAGEYTITCASLEIDASAIISGETTYQLQLYNVTPPSALGDNAAWDIPSGDRTAALGPPINLGTPADLGSTLMVEQCNLNKQITTLSANVFGYLVTTGTYTPTASRVYKVTLHSVKSY